MNNHSKIVTVLALFGLLSATILNNPSSTVQAQEEELNTNDFQYTLHITDIIPYYTWDGMSKVLTNGDQSFEDIDVFRIVIEDTNYYAVYNNNVSENTFEFSGIYENGA